MFVNNFVRKLMERLNPQVLHASMLSLHLAVVTFK
jgi:hypothetical protein